MVLQSRCQQTDRQVRKQSSMDTKLRLYSVITLLDLSLQRTVAGGASRDKCIEPILGYAQVFTLLEESGWIQLGNDIIGKADSDRAGRTVSLSPDGRTVAVGSISSDGRNNINSGQHRIYRFQTGVDDWVQIGRDIDDEAVGDEFGFRRTKE